MLSILRQRTVKYIRRAEVGLRKLAGIQGKRSERYFGYGANLSADRLTASCMNVKELGNARLPNHQLRFSLANEYLQKGYAGIHESSGSDTWGVVFELDEPSLKLLDAMEWAGFGAYERRMVEIELNANTTIVAWAYFVKSPRSGLLPSEQYLNSMIRTAEKRNFPLDYIAFLKSHPSRSEFELDHSFSLLFYGRKRPFSKQLWQLYRIHDRFREWLCRLI